MRHHTVTTAIVWGLIGGLVGTIIMDLIIAGFFLIVGMPVDPIHSLAMLHKVSFYELGSA